MTDNNDNQNLQHDRDEFRFDDDTDQFFDEAGDVSLEEERPSTEKMTKTQKFRHKLSGLGGKFSVKMPKFKHKISGDKIPSKLKNRRVVIGIIFVVLVIIIYLFLGGSSSSNNPAINGNIQSISSKPMAASQVQQMSMTGSATKPASFAVQGLNPAQQTTPMKMPVVPPTPQSPPLNITEEFAVKPAGNTPVMVAGVSEGRLTAALNDVSAQMKAEMSQQMQMLAHRADQQYVMLTQESEKLADQMTGLQQQLADLKNQMASSQKNITGLQSKVSDIVNGYVGSFNANGTTTFNNVPKPQPAVAIVTPAVTYVVQAIVPGRAWLYGSNGQTVSVGVGDKVDHYGNVMSIDSLTGTVTLSNGMVLKPGA